MKWILILVAVFALGWFLSARKRRNIFNTQTENKENNKKKILEFLHSKNRVGNDGVQHFLNVSDATATRYLDELEKEGKIRQSGRTGTGVSYSRM